MRNVTALCGSLFGVTGIVGISDACRALLESGVSGTHERPVTGRSA